MSRIYLKLNEGKWSEVEQSDFWMDEALYNKLISIKMIQEKGWDGVIVVDGKERSGKSVLGMVMGWYLSNGSLTLDNFARGLGDAAEKISRLPDKSVLIVDEASTVFASKDTMTEEGKQLIKIMDIVGQKNMVFILCLPCFFDLNKTMAVRRSLFLCHVYPDEKYNRGRYSLWGERSKKTLFIFGKKNYDSYSFPAPEVVGEYMDFEPPFYREYVEIVKRESLKEVLGAAIKLQAKSTVSRAVRLVECKFYTLLHDKFKMSLKDLRQLNDDSEDTIYTKMRDYRASNTIK
jgi:hypothetical protein